MRLRQFLVTLLATAVAVPALTPAAAQQPAQPVVYQVPVTGTIELGIAPFIKRALREAEQAGARAVVLDVNTLGGRVDAALQIVDAIGAAKIPVYALVHPRAISAGALIAIAADSVFMTPDALMGASTVVGQEGEKVSEKAQSMMRAQFRALAERRGIDPRIGEAMVDEDVAVPGLTEKGKLLTLTTQEAVKVGYAIEAANFDDLLVRVGITNAVIKNMDTNWAEALVRFLTHPIMAAILLPIGILAIFTELKAPTFGVAGLIGVAALALFFGSHMLVGLAGWEELILLGVGVVLIGLELFVIPGFGVAGVLGIASIGLAIFLAMLGNFHTSEDVWRAGSIFATSLLIIVITPFFLLKYLPKRRQTFGVLLNTATTRDEGYVSGVQRTDLLNAEGVALTDLRPAGTVQFGSERIDVVSESDFIAKNTRVRVVYAEPYRTVVLPVEGETGSGTGV